MKFLPKVSVIIPSFNQSQLLQEAVASVLAQTFTDFELIVVDNHSVDNTAEIMQAFLSDKRVLYIRNEQTIPMHENWTKGLGFARGEYIKMLCSDDVLTPRVLEKMVAAMESNPGVSVVSCGRKYIGDKDRFFVLNKAGRYNGKETVLNTLRTYNWLASPSTVMLKRKNFEITSGFGPYRWITDWEMWVRHLLLGDYFAIPDVLVYERVHNRSVTRSYNMNMIKLTEEYELFRKIRDGAYGPLFIGHQEEMKQLVRKKVLQCSAYMFAKIPKLNTAKNLQAFRRMFAIVFREQMLAASIAYFLKKRLPQISKPSPRPTLNPNRI